jgi:hypothetical protein
LYKVYNHSKNNTIDSLPTWGVTYLKNTVVGKAKALWEIGGWGTMTAVNTQQSLSYLFLTELNGTGTFLRS